MERLDTIESIWQFINNNEMVLLYFSTDDCGICTTLLPKIEYMITNYPKIKSVHISIDDFPVASGEFSVFTVPSIIVYIEGKEIIREARFISMDLLEGKIAKYYAIFFDGDV